MLRTEKVWGTTEPLIVSPMFELHRLDINPWHRCSLHIHRFKHNAFYVIGGLLFIDWLRADHEPVRSKMLMTGDYFHVTPGVHHQFRTDGQPCYALEMYYTEPLSEDIVRRDEGGPVEHS